MSYALDSVDEEQVLQAHMQAAERTSAHRIVTQLSHVQEQQ